MAFVVGSKWDVKYNSIWYIATIIEVTNNKIKVHYDCDGDDKDDDHWIDICINSDAIAKLNTHTTPINQLASPPFETGRNVFTIYYAHDGNKYIILCANAIIRYDITTNNWKKYSKYPDEMKTDSHHTIDDVCFDTHTFNLHLVYIRATTSIHATFNVIDKRWNVFELISKALPLGKTYLTYTGGNKVHAFILGRHGHYNISGAECIPVVDKTDANLRKYSFIFSSPAAVTSPVIWCEALGKLVKVKKDRIAVCDVECKQNEYHWTKLEIEMDGTHLKIDVPSVILAYKYIIFAFCYNCNKMCCIDLLNEKWYKVTKNIAIGADTTITKGDGNYAYLTDCDYNTFERISLLDIIPHEMELFWKHKVSNPLVFGYINIISKKYKLSNSIPYDIVNLILAFFPTFCE